MRKLPVVAILAILMAAVQIFGPMPSARAEGEEPFFDNLNESIRTKPSSLFGGLTGTEFMARMKEKYGRAQTVTLFSVMAAGAELSQARAGEVVEYLTPEMADDAITFYTMVMREAGTFKDEDDAHAKKIMAVLYNDLAVKYLAGDPATVALCDKNYGQSARAKMTVLLRLTTIFLENS